MKPLLLFVLLCLQSLSFAQITFEEIPTPNDFNIRVLRQSPDGEYFVQAANDQGSIYTSLDGQHWAKTLLPEAHELNDINFFSDGTPVLKPYREEHLIRRNGTWYTMDVSGGFNNVEASFIKDDTLFVYQDKIFAYSIDKGLSFTTLFTYPESIVDHSAELWKFDDYFILHHTAGASDYISVFTRQGQRVLFEEMDLYIRAVAFTSCGDILFADYDRYYLFKTEGLKVTSGNATDIFPAFSFSADIYALDDHYYLREGKTIYKTAGCNFTWEIVETSDLIQDSDHFWVNDQGDIFLYNNRSDYFSRKAYASNEWEEHTVDIDYASVQSINEAGQAHQIVFTSNALFSKNVEETNWTELDSVVGNEYQIKYSPGGNLYVIRSTDILYSEDNGHSFSTIQFPDLQIDPGSYSMEVLGDGILLLYDGILETCYYTKDNGLTWIQANIPPSVIGPIKVKLVENYIVVVTDGFEYVLTLINIANGETTSSVIGEFYTSFFYGSALQDDGTFYFLGTDIEENNPEGLYRYRIGEGLEFIGEFNEFIDIYLFTASGSDLYGFGHAEYYILNGESFEAFNYIGLPSEGSKEFYISENEYVYVIIDRHRIFRSTQPLTYPQHISGSIYHDSNKDCIVDTSDATLQYWQVKVEGDQYVRIKTSDRNGQFNFYVPRGEYTLSSQPLNTNWDICEPVFNITIDENTAAVNQDFQAIGLRDCANLELDFSTPRLRRCFDNYYSVNVRNTGPEASAGTILTFKLDPFFDFTSATIPYTLVGDSIVKFDLGVLAVNDEITFTIYFKLSCDAEPGMEHCLTGFLTDDNLCGGERSTYTECQENIGSYDPNDKRVFNEAGDEAERIDKGEYIYYHIRFQNTGTDTAFNIKVVDPLSPKLDLSTLEMLSASQSYEYFISDGPALVVLFDDVLLPDSTTNEPASHGFFKFRVKPLPEFDYGTSIPNQAGIYFDFNEPVLTNEATMFILPPVGTKEIKDLLEFNVFPNPATNVLTITFAENDGSRIDAYEIVDHLGRRITNSSFSNSNVISVAHLVPGIYNLMLKEKGSIVGMEKFVRL